MQTQVVEEAARLRSDAEVGGELSRWLVLRLVSHRLWNPHNAKERFVEDGRGRL